MRYFETQSGVVLHYAVRAGRSGGAPIVLANSLGTDFRIWDGFADQLGGAHPIIGYDKRGHGLSSCPPGEYSITDHGNDLAELLDHLGVRGAVLIGLSVGGMIAQWLGRHRPDLARGLVLCDTASKIGDAKTWNARMAAVRDHGMQAISGPVLERWFSADMHTRRPGELAIWRAMLERTPADGYIATCAGIRDADLTESTAKLKLPVMCVCGSEDGVTPPALVKSLCALIPGAGYREIAGASHLPPIEAPDILAALVGEFIQENGFV